MSKAGLRIDVDTFRGTRDGVPRLLETLDRNGVRATFFFSVGPDNMGRHLWRLLKPRFFMKMLRSNAASLYGWDILLAGTLWPGRRIGRELGGILREAAAAGHEIGLHAWDHHAWQAHAGRWSPDRLHREIARGFDCLADIIGVAPSCSAAAGWRADARVIAAKEGFGFRYNSDCRGHGLFRPEIGSSMGTPQVPADLPTYDELAGPGCSPADFTSRTLTSLQDGDQHVHTVHAEAEGILLADEFERLLIQAVAAGIQFGPLGDLLPTDIDTLPVDSVVRAELPGREGWLGFRAAALNAQQAERS